MSIRATYPLVRQKSKLICLASSLGSYAAGSDSERLCLPQNSQVSPLAHLELFQYNKFEIS